DGDALLERLAYPVHRRLPRGRPLLVARLPRERQERGVAEQDEKDGQSRPAEGSEGHGGGSLCVKVRAPRFSVRLPGSECKPKRLLLQPAARGLNPVPGPLSRASADFERVHCSRETQGHWWSSLWGRWWFLEPGQPILCRQPQFLTDRFDQVLAE